MSTRSIAMLIAAGAMSAPAAAALVQVTMHGTVEYNQVNVPPLDGNDAGSPVTVTFTVDSTNFVNSQSFNVRGYVVDQASFSMKVGNATVGLQNPLPVGETPYFVVRDNDFVVDGFYMSAGGVDFPNGVPLSAVGAFGNFRDDFSVSYDGDMLSSLDILGALGNYDFNGLKSYFWAVTDGGFEPIGIGYESMTIELVPAPAAFVPLALMGLGLGRRRR